CLQPAPCNTAAELDAMAVAAAYMGSPDEGDPSGASIEVDILCYDTEDVPSQFDATVMYAIGGSATPGTDHTLPAAGSWTVHVSSDENGYSADGSYTATFYAPADCVLEGDENN